MSLSILGPVGFQYILDERTDAEANHWLGDDQSHPDGARKPLGG